MKGTTIVAQFDYERLSENGRFLIDTARRQSRHNNAIFNSGRAILWDKYDDCDDPIRIRIVSTIGFADRAREYGVCGLDVYYYSIDIISPRIEPVDAIRQSVKISAASAAWLNCSTGTFSAKTWPHTTRSQTSTISQTCCSRTWSLRRV